MPTYGKVLGERVAPVAKSLAVSRTAIRMGGVTRAFDAGSSQNEK